MGMTRNERRKAAQLRLVEKQTRLAKAELGRQSDERQAIVKQNLRTSIDWAKEKADRSIGNTMAGFASLSHRGYVCRASGGMPRQRALALKARGTY